MSVPLFAATVPNRYIVQLSIEPVALYAALNGAGSTTRGTPTDSSMPPMPNSIAPLSTRSKQPARAAIEQSGGSIRGTLEALSALLVEIPDEKAGESARVPGVQAVYPVRRFPMSLDRALPLHHLPDAWTQIGLANAGAGVMICMIDSGIEIGRSGFKDAGFTAPPGFRSAR